MIHELRKAFPSFDWTDVPAGEYRQAAGALGKYELIVTEVDGMYGGAVSNSTWINATAAVYETPRMAATAVFVVAAEYIAFVAAVTKRREG